MWTQSHKHVRTEGPFVLGHCPSCRIYESHTLTHGRRATEQAAGNLCFQDRCKVTSFSLSLVFQRSNRAVVETLAYLPMAGEKALAFAMVTHSSLNASLPLSWWGRNQSRAKRITSGRLRSQAVCVSEQGWPLMGSPERQAGSLVKALPLETWSGYPQRHLGWFLLFLGRWLSGFPHLMYVTSLDLWRPSLVIPKAR